MSRRNRHAQMRREAALADPASAVSLSTDPERDQYAHSRTMVDPRPDRASPAAASGAGDGKPKKKK